MRVPGLLPGLLVGLLFEFLYGCVHVYGCDGVWDGYYDVGFASGQDDGLLGFEVEFLG